MIDASLLPRTGHSLPFRFNADRHHYVAVDTGEVLPHVTGMMERCDYVDTRWFTEESRIRGTSVHRRSEQFELGLIEASKVRGKYRGWFLAYVEAMRIIQPRWVSVEERIVHPTYRFGGTLDRVGLLWDDASIVDLKSGVKLRAHGIQTALQAVLAEVIYGIPATAWNRFSLYLRENGKFILEEHPDRGDIYEARGIIEACCA